VSGSGSMMCLLAVALPDPASYAVSVETLTFLFTDIEGSTALLRGWETTVTRRYSLAITR
jgi:hypothetical protein